jgi:hypothetical protein
MTTLALIQPLRKGLYEKDGVHGWAASRYKDDQIADFFDCWRC